MPAPPPGRGPRPSRRPAGPAPSPAIPRPAPAAARRPEARTASLPGAATAAADALTALDRYEHWRESLEGRLGGEALPGPMLDGYLCGILLQPRPVPLALWWGAAVDPEDAAPARRSPPPTSDAPALEAMRRIAIERHEALDAAIEQRQWFDPWVLDGGDPAPEGAPGPGPGLEDDEDDDGSVDERLRAAVYPWVAGFAHAMACFDDLLELSDPAAAEPQALLCQFLDPDDLEDADALLDLIETLEPPADLDEAVEMLVRATLLLADLTRPRPADRAPARPARHTPERPRPAAAKPRRPRR